MMMEQTHQEATNKRVTPPLLLTLLVGFALALTLAAFAPAAQAQELPEPLNERILVAFEMVSECTEETFFVEGTLHLVGHTTKDAAGGYHLKGHTNLQGKAVGESGAGYVFVSGGNNPLSLGSGAVQTLVFHANLVRQGETGFDPLARTDQS